MSASSLPIPRRTDEGAPAPVGDRLVSVDGLDALAERARRICDAEVVLVGTPAGGRMVVLGIAGLDAGRHRGTVIELDPSTLGPATTADGLPSGAAAALEAVAGASPIVVPVGDGADVEAVIVVAGVEDPAAAVALVRAVAAGAETGLAAARAAAREALSRLTARSEHRRRHWARELHDQTLQELAAVRMTVERAAGACGDERVGPLLGEAVAQIDVATLELRRIVADLRPAKLDEGGLRQALTALAERYTALFDLDVSYECDRCGRCAPGGGLDPQIEGVIYRVVQEALTNVIRHASGTRAHVRVAAADGRHMVTITDDGTGFDSEELVEGFGIAGMRERAATVRGVLALDSEPGVGTTVRLTIPTRAPRSRD